MQLIQIFKNNWFIILLSFTIFIFRQSGNTWGFPGILHSDESVLVRTALGMRFDTLNPHHFDWPSLYFYINYFIFWIFIKLRTQIQILFGVEYMQINFPFWWGPELPFYYLARTLSNIFSASTILLTYIISLKIFKEKNIAILAAIFFSAGTITNYLSYYGLSDSALTFFMLISMLFSIEIIKSEKWRYYILSAIFAGLATSTKYHGFLACIVLLTAHIIKTRKIKSIFDKKLIISAIVSISAFFITTPYSIIDWKTFLNTQDATGALWQINHMGSGYNWGYYLFDVIPNNFGWPISISAYLGMIILTISKKKELKLFAISFFIFLIYIGTWEITRSHYGLIMLPFMAIFSSYFYIKIISPRISRLLQIVTITSFLLIPFYYSSIELIKRNNIDTRIVSGIWIDTNIPKGSVIVSTKNRTGYFGGDLPVFAYDNYKLLKPEEITKEENFYTIYIFNEEIPKIEEKEMIIYYLDNNLRTGQKIIITKI